MTFNRSPPGGKGLKDQLLTDGLGAYPSGRYPRFFENRRGIPEIPEISRVTYPRKKNYDWSHSFFYSGFNPEFYSGFPGLPLRFLKKLGVAELGVAEHPKLKSFG